MSHPNIVLCKRKSESAGSAKTKHIQNRPLSVLVVELRRKGGPVTLNRTVIPKAQNVPMLLSAHCHERFDETSLPAKQIYQQIRIVVQNSIDFSLF